MHNGLLADPKAPYSRLIKEITSKRTKTESDYDELEKLEWLGGLYFAEYGSVFALAGKVKVVIPSDNIERCIQLGAQKTKRGKDIQSGVLCSDTEIEVEYEGPKDLAKMFADPAFMLRKGVRVQKNRIIRVRPMIPTGWKIKVRLEYDKDQINEQNIRRAMLDAGSFIGLGDWRPKFGRFLVE